MTAVLSLTGLLLLGAFVVTVLAGINRAPLWVAVLLLVVANLLALGFGAR